ncbi:MAG: MFS transporter [Eubacteriales bacterium]
MKTRIKENYQATIYACYLGCIVQGIINNVSPILFAIYQSSLGISLDKIGLLIAINFGTQIIVDLLAVRYGDQIGYRRGMVVAHTTAAVGLLSMGILPMIMSNAFVGLVFATVLNGIGGGLLEVMVSPIVEAIPSDAKDKAMSILHSFYCWGCLVFILASTIILHFIGKENWFVIPLMWAILPVVNTIMFANVPIMKLVEESERVSVLNLFKQKILWVLILLMICAGASELAMSQWASYFAEIGLGVNKTFGDILGPCFFAFAMGSVRLYYGKREGGVDLNRFIIGSCILCIFSYALAVFAPHPILGLIGCGLCGFSVAILWPGVFSIAARECRAGGTAMFAILAFAGDIGAMSGPGIIGVVAEKLPAYGIKAGLLVVIIFPAVMLTTMLAYGKKWQKI